MNQPTAARRIHDAQALADQIMAARAGFAPGVTMHGSAVITRLEAERQACFDFIDQLTGQVETEGRDLVDAERQNIEAQQTRVREIDAQLTPLRDFESLRGAHQQTTSRYEPTGGGTQRGAAGGNPTGGAGLGSTQVREREHEWRSPGEFMADVYRASPQARRDGQRLERGVTDGAAERLRSHGLTVEHGMLDRAAAPHNTTAEVPGLLPHTIIGPIMSDVDAARPFVSSIGARDLGGIPGLTFERPVVTQHVAVGKQTSEKSQVANRQFEVEGIPFAKDTYGGWANVSRQSINWTSPGVWDALLTDFIEQYGLETEEAAATAFATSVTQEVELGGAAGVRPTLDQILTGFYEAAVLAYRGSGRMPDHIWASLDWWTTLGPIIDHLKATTAGDGGGDSSVTSFAGNLLRVPRTIVPSFPAGTLVIGVGSRTEVYEDRIGFLSVIEPKVFGVELAYGGYMASGTVKPAAFAKLVNKV